VRRRTLVILVSLVTLIGIVAVAIVSVGVGVYTSAGRDRIRQTIQAQIASKVNGKVYVGNVSGRFINNITIDSFAIRGEDDSLFVSTGRVTLEYNLADLLDQRVLVRNVTVEHPVMRLEKFPSGDWNHWRIFRRPPSNLPKVPGRRLGDFVVLDSVTIREGSFTLIRGWSPPDSLTGARRDSAIRFALKDTAREFRRTSGGLTHVQRWRKINMFLPHVRYAHPDSGAFGREFIFERGSVDEQEPPFQFSNVSGKARHQGDTVFFDIPHLDLPASTGNATGKIFWGNRLPDRWDVRIRGDSVALKDIAWIYPTLPRTGSGRMNLHIHNSIDNLSVMEYALTDLDVRTESSRMTGAMTFAVGSPVLGIKDVNLRFAPMNFNTIRTLAGGPFPQDWQGDLVGMAQGPGGPLTNFVLDTANITFRDAHVKGAVSRFTGRGELDILQPEFTKFHGFQVTTDLVDLRTIQYLFPAFPRLGGTVSGLATLDSSWLDVRFSNADISHTNGPEDPSHFTGKGRVTWGEKYMRYDVDLDAKRISMPQFSRVYDLGLTGYYAGPVKARGITPNLRVIANLTGAGGRFTYDGTVDADGLNVGFHGNGRVEGLQLGQAIENYKAPAAWLTGDYKLDFVYDTNDAGTMKGAASMTVERSEFGDTKIFPSRIVTRFNDRRMFIDTLRLESTAATVDAAGAIGIKSDRTDSLAFLIQIDSLGGVRKYAEMLLKPKEGAPPDSLSGTATLNGWMHGAITSFRLAGQIDADEVVVRRDAGRQLAGTFDIANPFTAPTGTVALRSKTLKFGRVAFDTLGVTLRLNEGKTGAFAFGARETNGANFSAQGEFVREDSATLVSLRSVTVATDASRWLLSGSSNIRLANRDIGIDSLVLLGDRGGRIAMNATVPESGFARLMLQADSVPLRDIGVLAQVRAPMGGWASATIVGAGTRSAPVFNADARFSNILYDSLRLDRGTGHVEYAAGRAGVRLDLARGNTSVVQLEGSLPVGVEYFGFALLEDSIRARLRTEGASLDLAQAFIPGLRDATGKLLASIDVGGTWSHPDVTGSVTVTDGEATIEQLGIRLKGIQVDLGLFGHADSLAVRRLVGWNGASPSDSISLSGFIGYGQFANPMLNLRLDARNFYAIDKRSVARLYVSTEPGGLTLRGPLARASASGGIIIDRGTVFLPDPELLRKQNVDIRAEFADTASGNRRVLLDARSRFLQMIALEGVNVTLGEEVSLRSTEADIHLTGSLRVLSFATGVRSLTIGGEDTVQYQLVYDGTLRADRGTYTLNLLEAVRRKFDVQSGGAIVFYPSPNLPAQINITALSSVRRANQADLRIRVHLTGALANPDVALESGESYPMSQTDMVSYLVFGVPSYALGDRDNGTLQLALKNVVPTLQAAFSSKLGSLFGNLQITPGAYNYSSDNTKQSLTALLYTTRVGREWQLSENAFASVSTGLCQLNRTNATSGQDDLAKLADGLSAKLEYRLSPSMALKAGREPAASALNCGNAVSGRAFIPTPQQWGFSLFKSWRF
jgi:translocation and assembly module TamB